MAIKDIQDIEVLRSTALALEAALTECSAKSERRRERRDEFAYLTMTLLGATIGLCKATNVRPQDVVVMVTMPDGTNQETQLFRVLSVAGAMLRAGRYPLPDGVTAFRVEGEDE